MLDAAKHVMRSSLGLACGMLSGVTGAEASTCREALACFDPVSPPEPTSAPPPAAVERLPEAGMRWRRLHLVQRAMPW